jgi:hypothetical protein
MELPMTEKTHFRKAFDSPYLSSADIVEPTTLTVKRVALEKDKTKKTKDQFNTAYFAEREIRPGEPLKPMILNATNSKTMKALTGSAFIEDWTDVRVTVYVDKNVKFGNETMEGLRISPKAPNPESPARDAAKVEAKQVASLGVEKFRAMWKGWPVQKRQLVIDLLPSFQRIAEKADAEQQVSE